MLIFEGIPLTCLELAVGQRYGKASLFKAWNNLVPSLRGLGLSAFAVNLTCVFYYNVLVSWCLYYAVQSLRDMLIWEPCSLKANRTFEQAKEEECIKAGSEKYFWYRESLNAAKDINQFSGKPSDDVWTLSSKSYVHIPNRMIQRNFSSCKGYGVSGFLN